MQRVLLDFLEGAWRQPDDGIWEMRSGRQDFVHSKVMDRVAFDRAVRTVELSGSDGLVDRWRAQRAAFARRDPASRVRRRSQHVCACLWVQGARRRAADAPARRLLPVDDPRVGGTVAAIRRELVEDGFVLRYPTEYTDDGLPGSEGSFLPCTFWLVQCLGLLGRPEEAARLFERLLALRNDVGLLSEEYDTRARRRVGNFPQAFSHAGLVNSATSLRAHRA